MHKKHADKQILKVGIVVIALIILVSILFSISPRDALVGQAAGGSPDNSNACADAATPVGPVTTSVEAADGTPISSSTLSVCCPRSASSCTRTDGRFGSGGALLNPICHSRGEVIAAPTSSNGFDLCSRDDKWVRCRPNQQGDNGIIVDGFICVAVPLGALGNIPAGSWVSISTGCGPINNGESFGSVSYCNGQDWVGPPQCSIVTSESYLPDGTPTRSVTGQSCCPANSCTLFGVCHQQGNRPFDTNALLSLSYFCKLDGNWEECDSSSPISRGTISSNNRFVCHQNDEWVPVAQSCTFNNFGRSYGNAYCDSTTNKWTSCVGTNVFCPNSRDALEDTTICNSIRANTIVGTVLAAPDAGTHYCSFDQSSGNGAWIQCDQTTEGQGVSNAEPNSPYVFNYVCSRVGGSNTLAWQPINCPASVCGRGVASAQCVGSNQVDIITRTSVAGSVQYVSNPTQLVGCAVSGGCYYDSDSDPTSTPNSYAYDEVESTNIYVCGGANSWLTCQSGTAPTPSDGGKYLCSGSWLECVENAQTGTQRSVDTQIGNFVCLQTSPGKFEWFSSFVCTANDKYRLVDTNTRICDGERYVSCPIPIDSTLLTDPNVRVSCGVNNIISVEELACNNVGPSSLPIDDDNNGLANCNDPVCLVTQSIRISSDDNFSVTLRSSDCFSTTVEDLIGVDYYTNLKLCDEGSRGSTVGVADRATLCYSQSLAPGGSGDFIIESLNSLRNNLQTMSDNQNPVTPQNLLSDEGVTFVYGRPSAVIKEVKIALTLDISNNDETLPIGKLAQNMLNEQIVVIIIDGQYYLIEYPTAEILFSLDRLVMRHLPTNENIISRPYLGTNSYIFNVGERSIVVTADASEIRFSAITPGERAIAFQREKNVTRSFEINIIKETPIRLKHQGSGLENQYTVCRRDLSADTDEALFCVDNLLTLALKQNNLTYYSPNNGLDEYAVLYNYNGSDKILSIFKLIDLNNNYPAVDHFPVDYVNYITNMVAGRRLAVRYADKLYLLSHTVQPTFSQLLTKLTSHVEGVATDFSAQGSEGLVDYNILDGRVSMKRTYGQVPPLPFQLRRMSTREILDQPLNLLYELSTSMSSEVPISVSGPVNYGILEKNPLDHATTQAKFSLRRQFPTTTPPTSFDLDYRVQEVQEQGAVPSEGSNKVLLNYNSAQVLGSVTNRRFIKTVSMHLLYDLDDPGNFRHPYNSTFLESFTKGKEIALKLGKYYLLSYEGAASAGQDFFTLDKLVLKSLDKSQTFNVEVSGLEAKFTVPEGQIQVNLQLNTLPATSYLVFKGGLQALQEKTFEPVGYDETSVVTDAIIDYMVPLTLTNSVVVGDSVIGGVQFDICNEEQYALSTETSICIRNLNTGEIYGGDGNSFDEIAVRSPTLVVVDRNGNLGTVNDQEHFVLETNGRTGNAKQVFIRRVINMPRPRFVSVETYNVLNWNYFARNVSLGFGPVFNISGGLYSPEISGGLLKDLTFRGYSDNVRYNVKQESEVTSILWNVTYALHDNIVIARQDLTGDSRNRVVDVEFTHVNQKYLPDDKSEILLNATVNPANVVERFMTDIEGLVYGVGVVPGPVMGLVGLTLQDEKGVTYIDRFFAEGDEKTLRLGDEMVTLTVSDIGYGANGAFIHAHLKIKRR
jgi:hypothetical protein